MRAKKDAFSFKFRLFKDIGIDLGTANTLVFMKGKGIILNEPSVVAVDARTGELLAVGDEAREMIGRTPMNIIASRPLKDGVIADFNTTRLMLKYFIHKSVKRNMIKPRVLIGIPLGITQVEKRAVLEAAHQAGAKEAYLIEEPIAAAIGAGLPVSEARGSMIVDIGGGTTEVALISLGGIVVGKSLRIGGDEMNHAIIRHMRRVYNLEIGDRTAENTKIEIGYAIDAPKEHIFHVKGRNLATGLPNSVEVSATEISDALTEPLQAIIESVQATLEKTPPELAADILDFGMTLTGGGAQLKNIDRLLVRASNMPVFVADDPMSCVVRGTGRALEEIGLLKTLAVSNAG